MLALVITELPPDTFLKWFDDKEMFMGQWCHSI